MNIEIVAGSWEHKLLESVLEHRDEIADVCMWEQDTFDQACRYISKQLQQGKGQECKTSDKDVDHILDQRITAAQISVDYIEARIGLVESDESLTSDEYRSRVADLESERDLCQKELDVLWSLRTCISGHVHNSEDRDR